MRYRYLGRTGLRVSELCFGVMTFGAMDRWEHIGTVKKNDAEAQLGMALDSGVNFIDTADVYSFGLSESILGSVMGERRKDIVLATKVGFAVGEGPNAAGLTRRRIIEACEESLRRLRTDYIDLYQVHCYDPVTPQDETLGALDDLVRSGKVRYVGCSNFAAWHLMKALAISDAGGFERYVALQARYNLVCRDLEYELVPLCLDQGVGILPWGPLEGGFLTGKYRRDVPRPKGARLTDAAMQLPFDQEKGFDVVEELHRIANERGRSVSQVALNYLLAKPGVTSVIFGARNRKQLADNLETVEWSLSDDEMNRLDAISQPPELYPYWFIRQLRKDRLSRADST